jgi:hypothetical protein
MRSDYSLLLCLNDGSARHFHIYGRPPPSRGEVITIPVDGRLVKALIETQETNADPASAVERLTPADQLTTIRSQEEIGSADRRRLHGDYTKTRPASGHDPDRYGIAREEAERQMAELERN